MIPVILILVRLFTFGLLMFVIYKGIKYILIKVDKKIKKK